MYSNSNTISNFKEIRKMKRKISFLLALLCVLSAASCGSATNDGAVTTAGSTDDTTTAAETEPAYEWPDVDLGGKKFSILNSSTTWGFYTTLDLEAETGDVLDDAVYRRNSLLEDKLNFEFDVTEIDIESGTIDKMKSSVMSGEDVYQCGFLRGENLSPLISEGMFVDLNTMSGLRLDEPYWDQQIRDAASIGENKALYIAGTDFSLMGFGGTICTYFNKDMLEKLGGESPYQLVRDGKWTLDRMKEYAALGANLNGDTSFDFSADGNATYGIATWYSGATAMLLGSGEEYIKRDDNNRPHLAIENDHFYNVCEKIAGITSVKGEFIEINDSSKNKHYELAFADSRCLMTIAEIKASNKFRDMNDSFGILPMPKYDENQENYVCYRAPATTYLCVPVTNTTLDETAAVLDAASWLSYTDVLPVYYNVTNAQKGLRDEESIEMLEIIQSSRYFDTGRVFGWTTTLYDSIETSLLKGKSDVASKIANQKSKVETNIEKTWEKLAGN